MKRHLGKSNHSIIFTVITAILVSIIAVVISSLLCSVFAYKSSNPTEKVGLLSTLALTVSGCICGIYIAKFKGEGGVGCAFISSIAFALILILSKLIFSGTVGIYAAVNSLCYAGSCILSSYVGKPKKRKRRY